jgi:hypothetical protein
VNLVLSSSLVTIRTLTAQLKPLARAIAAELEAVPAQTIRTIPGLGPVLTAGIVSEIGDIGRFEGEEQLAKFAGLTWRRHQSGEFEGEDRALTKTGNRYLRYHLVEAANSVRLHCPEFGSYYRTKYREATRHKHKRALVLTARKLVRWSTPCCGAARFTSHRGLAGPRRPRRVTRCSRLRGNTLEVCSVTSYSSESGLDFTPQVFDGPRRVLSGESEDERADLSPDRGASRAAAIRPSPRHEPPVPAQSVSGRTKNAGQRARGSRRLRPRAEPDLRERAWGGPPGA